MSELDLTFIARFFINVIAITLLTYACYYRSNRNTTVTGSLILFGIGIFVITYFLHGVDMSMEFAFGLFAVFTMLRYRTESISIKEMTYLFLVTAIALISSVGQMPLSVLFALNISLCVLAFIVESQVFSSRLATQAIRYEKIENITPKNRELLLSDLRQRTGLNIQSVQIQQIDFLRDVAELTVTYLPETSVIRAVDQTKISTNQTVDSSVRTV
jgi:hypothetical protein